VNKPSGRPGSWFRPKGTLDLHRFTAAESEDMVEDFLHREFQAGHEWVLLVHGAKKLSGVVSRLLDRHPLVEDHEPEPGNPGATRVRLGRRR
jgi:DNA-nicking Smr family endonuclease